MREVEVKFRVCDANALLEQLESRGIALGEPMRQDDQAYARNGWSYGMDKARVPFARLRTQDGRHLFTVKMPQDNELACSEHETHVADREQMHEAILAMGFWPTVRIEKTRRTGIYEGISLCLDDVDGLGVFLELERLVPDDTPADIVQNDLAKLVTLLGVEVERITETYDSLIRARSALA